MDYDLNYEKQFLGLLAKQAREEKEWDQEYLADELDIDIRTVRKIESGQGNIAYDLLTEIIHTLEICPQVLFYVDEADKGMKMDRLYRELLRLPLEDIKMVAESAYKVRDGWIAKLQIQRRHSRSARVSRNATPFDSKTDMPFGQIENLQYR